jgi:riboflavin kinase / FMN adenylyltransferase
MFIFDDLAEVPANKNTIITLGTFDGIHLGHNVILEKVIAASAREKARSMLVTFEPHPRNVLSKDFSLKILSTRREKIELLEKLDLDNIFFVKFTKEFALQTAEEFFQKYVIEGIGVKEIIVGYDHHFGKGRMGNLEMLKEIGSKHGFNVTVVDEVKLNDQTISSTKIRNALSAGDIELANSYLGRYYSFSGTVVEGDKRGRDLGFPTANIKLEEEFKMLPASGIYAVEVIIDSRKLYGLLSIGTRPTFHTDGNIVPEVYLFDFEKDLYGDFVTVNLIKMLREQEKFSSPGDLIAQMKKDEEEGLKIFKELKLIN